LRFWPLPVILAPEGGRDSFINRKSNKERSTKVGVSKSTANTAAGFADNGISLLLTAGAASFNKSPLIVYTAADVQEAKNGSTAANRVGQAMHKAYKAGLADKVKTFKEYMLPSGKRIDFLDAAKGIVYDLKPNNTRAIREGGVQVDNYIKELQRMPEFKNIKWQKVIDVY
jgi:hypothetical protein